MRDLERFSACSWEVAGLAACELGRLEAEVRERHPESGMVRTCQRLEAFSLSQCECGAPAQLVGPAALEHLAALAAGLESAVLGEYQVLGQVRAGVAPLRSLVPWIDDALATARKLRAEANLHATTGGLLSLALELAAAPARGRLLVIGAGAAGRDVARHALALGFEEVWIASRRRPEPPVEGVAGWIPLREASLSAPFDVLVSCLGPSAGALSAGERPAATLAIDLGSPPNLAPGARPVIGLGDIVRHARANSDDIARRDALRTRLRELLSQRLAQAAQDAASPVGMMRLAAERVRHREARRIARLHPSIPPDAVESITRGLVNQLLHAPSERLRRLEDPTLARQLAALFAPSEATS